MENGTTIVVAVPLTVVLRRKGRKTPDATTVSMSSVICIQFELEALSLDHLSGRLECFCGNVLLYSKGYAFLYLSSSTS